MQVVTLCEHLTRGDRTPDHWDPYCVVGAVKGRRFTGSAAIEIDGYARRLRNDTADIVLDWAAERLSRVIARRIAGRVALVPIPGHACTSAAAVRKHRLMLLAERIAGRCDARAAPVLWWRSEQPEHRSGAARNPYEMLSAYACSPFLPRADTVVLLDDVVTTGAHLYAAERFLTKRGLVVAEYALAVAHTTHDKTEPFKVRAQTYDPWSGFEVPAAAR
jgi:hypothetical protein